MKLEPRSENARIARNLVRTALAEWGHEPELDVVVLLTSELMTNTILHAGPHGFDAEVVVRLRQVGDVVRVEVEDSCSVHPTIGNGDLSRASGRGMRLVDSMARVWGVTTTTAGKFVWFEVQA